jgi:hypothetical protein
VFVASLMGGGKVNTTDCVLALVCTILCATNVTRTANRLDESDIEVCIIPQAYDEIEGMTLED